MIRYAKWIGLGVLILLSFVAIFFIGQKFGGSKVRSSFVTNIQMIKEIAELGAIEVKGTASITTTNVEDDGSWFNMIKKTLIEKTVTLNMPYSAKYGVDMGNDKFKITENDTEIQVTMPHAKLLSFEAHLDQKQAMINKGYFMFPDENSYNEAESKLYKKNKEELGKNAENLKKAEDRVSVLMQQYFKPFQKTVRVEFIA